MAMTEDQEATLLMRVEDQDNRLREVTTILESYHELTRLMIEQIEELRLGNRRS